MLKSYRSSISVMRSINIVFNSHSAIVCSRHRGVTWLCVSWDVGWLTLFVCPCGGCSSQWQPELRLINVRVEQTDDDAFLCLHCFRSIFFRSGDCRMESRYCYWIAASDHRIRYELINKNQFSFVSPLQKLTQRWSFYANIRVWWSACVRR